MSSFKAGEILTKNFCPCHATPTVAISDACREIRRLLGESKVNDYVTYMWCFCIIDRLLSAWHIELITTWIESPPVNKLLKFTKDNGLVRSVLTLTKKNIGANF